MISDKFVLLGLAAEVYGCSAYALDTYRGKTKPNRVTWFLWFLAPVIAFAAEINKGVGLRSLMTLSVGISPLIVLLVSFANKRSYWQLRKSDYICGALSVLGLALWWAHRDANIAIVFSIAADALAAAPTLIKSYYHPHTETVEAYSMAIFNSAIALLTIKIWSVANYGFPIYIFLINIVFVALIYFKVGQKIQAGRQT